MYKRSGVIKISANLARSFTNELNAFSQKNVIVTTKDGKVVKGMLIGLNIDDMSLVLGDAQTSTSRHHRIFLSGSTIAEIVMGEAPFNLNQLRIELEKIFKKTGVRYFEDTRTILVMDRYKVTEEEVDGEGPVADRIRRIWQTFKDEYNQAKQIEE